MLVSSRVGPDVDGNDLSWNEFFAIKQLCKEKWTGDQGNSHIHIERKGSEWDLY